ncbi:MAG: DUF4159 domain-containing protein [Prolixibacteraceae bacterium]|nr:DUF4159 domain-containing protein [Prolixibacteraceae bacterium]MBN2649726.1 DUF4159 domain-containing protein [Prolixibacteraceae bacterium]
MRKLIFFLFVSLSTFVLAQNETTVKIALLKYNGGGDWYSDPTALPNLIEFVNQNLDANIHPVPSTVETGSFDIFNFPFVHMTGHGNVFFSDNDAEVLRAYLMSGGFLHIDDNYGLDPYIRREMKKIFPEQEFVELPFDHPIYHQEYEFENGLPKIHEHDGKAPQGFGLYYEDRLVVFYTYECDLGDGWESAAVHNNPQHIREKALQMGANIISYVFNRDKNIP